MTYTYIGLHVGRCGASAFISAFNDEVSFGKTAPDVTACHLDRWCYQVAAGPDVVNLRCPFGHCRFQRRHYRERLVDHINQCQRFLGDFLTDGCDGGDGLAPVAHLAVENVLVLGQRSVARGGRAVVQHARHILVRQHRLDPGVRECTAGVDRNDVGVCHRTAQRTGVEHAGQAHVASIAGAASDLFDHIPAACRGADDIEGHDPPPAWRRSCAAPSTASKILV